jgi:hypothetical protein
MEEKRSVAKVRSKKVVNPHLPQNNNDKNDNDFGKIYAEVVTEAMSVLGEGTTLITNYLEQKYSITLADTADSPKALSEALGAALDGSMRIIQRRILRLLYERINIKFPSSMTIDFEERIIQVRKAYEKLGASSSPSPDTT